MKTEITTSAGRFTGEERGNGWLILDEFELNMEVPPDQVMQRVVCPHTGEAFSKLFDGRYKDLSDEEQSERLEVLREFIRTLSGRPVPDYRLQPIWIQVEFLENVIDFELHPPCGCEPVTRQEV